MANQTAKSLLDAIDPNASSDDEDDQDFSLPETRPSKRRKVLAKGHELPVAGDQERPALDSIHEKAERLRKADAEWQALLQVEEDAKRERMASSTSSTARKAQTTEEEMVEVRRPRNFAGEIIYETVNLPASHPDVKKYKTTLVIDQPVGTAQRDPREPPVQPDPGQEMAPSPRRTDPSAAMVLSTSEATLLPVINSSPQTDATIPTSTKDKFRPGPVKRKRPRQSLESMNAELNRQAAAAKKMSTFEKSQMDWKQLTSTSATLNTDLEANRRAGGFLDKQDFLGRVAGRREDEARGVGEDRRRK